MLRAVLTVHQQLSAGVDLLTRGRVAGRAAVEALSGGLHVLDAEVQPGPGGGRQRPVDGRRSSEAPGELLGRVGGAGAAEGDAGTPDHHERPVGQRRGRADGRRHVIWTA